jgi:hypothetical protein
MIAEATAAAEPAAYDIESFCHAHHVGRTFVYSEIRAGRLVARRAGRKRTLITREAAAAWREALPIINRQEK